MRAVKPQEIAPGIAYSMYTGEWDSIPSFSRLTPVREGVAKEITCLLPEGDERFGLRFRGFLRVPRSGVYTLGLISDDGSRLIFHDTVVIDNDGAHAATERVGHVALEEGFHPVHIDYFERSGSNMLGLYIKGPGMDRQSVPGGMLFHSKEF
jgi:hypothetical protein